MLNEKMKNVVKSVNDNLSEREELVETIALALLTRKNLFVLGKPGQAKSQAIDLFRSHIDGAKQFEILMSKGTDAEQLFGRLDLASIIPGHVAKSRLNEDAEYTDSMKRLEDMLSRPQNDDCLKEMKELEEKIEIRKKAISLKYGGTPEMITANKIPDSHICFLDEIFKSGDGVLNSLLKALNERVYTNEGVTADIPVISFFSASNEIPNFNNPEEKSLQALYDRFDFKVITHNVAEKSNRMRVLKMKQGATANSGNAGITLDELYAMQEEVKNVTVPDSINELADNILCELRRRDIDVSDRTYFNYSPVVKAKAWLCGRDTVESSDMLSLVNYLWNKPEEYAVVKEVITKLIENPIGEKLDKLFANSCILRDSFNASDDKNKALRQFRKGIVPIYDELQTLKGGLTAEDPTLSAIVGTETSIEEINKEIHEKTNFTYITMGEIKALEN